MLISENVCLKLPILFNTGCAITDNIQVPILQLPSFGVAVIVTVPETKAVTSPLLVLTIAMRGLLDDHVTFLLVALDGHTVATSVEALPGFN